MAESRVDGDRPRISTCEIVVDGRALTVQLGQMLAVALWNSGQRTLRLSRSGQARGLVCAMGVCHECLVEVDGIAGQRACMLYCRPAMQVRSIRSEGGRQ